jgi:hypothetical protein
MADYFADLHLSEPKSHGEPPRMIGVMEAPSGAEPIGTAALIGPTDSGLPEWSLRVRGTNLPGRWVILGNWFVSDDG